MLAIPDILGPKGAEWVGLAGNILLFCGTLFRLADKRYPRTPTSGGDQVEPPAPLSSTLSPADVARIHRIVNAAERRLEIKFGVAKGLEREVARQNPSS